MAFSTITRSASPEAWCVSQFLSRASLRHENELLLILSVGQEMVLLHCHQGDRKGGFKGCCIAPLDLETIHCFSIV